MAARGLGRSMSAIQKSALALWAPSSPKVHIQGNLSTGFRENRGQERMPLLLSQLPGLGPAPSYIGPSFPSHRAGLDEGNVPICLGGGASRFLTRLLRLS